MKSFKLFSLLLVTGLLFVLTQSCEEAENLLNDPCDDITCQNGGTCDSGTCDCPDGFSGTNCEIEDLCITNPIVCENGGTANADCTACDCAAGFSGDNCETHCSENLIGTYKVTEGGTSFCNVDKYIIAEGATSNSVIIDFLTEDGTIFLAESNSLNEDCTTITYTGPNNAWTGTISFDGNKLTDEQTSGCTFVAEKQ